MLLAIHCTTLLGLLISSPLPFRRSSQRRQTRFRTTTISAEILPPSFLPPANFSRAVDADRCINKLVAAAPSSFTAPPPSDIFADEIVLTGDLGQELARGRENYLAAFAALVRVSSSPLLPVTAGDLEVIEVVPGAEQLEVAWRTPVRLGNEPFASNVELTGRSTYALGRGKLISHGLSDLRLDSIRLPSSTLAEFLTLAQRKGGPAATSPGDLLALLAQVLQQGQPLSSSSSVLSTKPARAASSIGASTTATAAAARSSSGGRGSATAGDDSAEDADGTAGSASGWPPLPGTVAWPAYAAAHTITDDLARQFAQLLERAPAVSEGNSIYAEAFVLKSARNGERLLKGRSQYEQLLSSLVRVHQAVTTSPLISHSFEYRLAYNGEAAEWARLGDALPAALLGQLGRLETSAPEVLEFFSTAFLALSESILPPSAAGASKSDSASAALGGSGSSAFGGASDDGSGAIAATFAVGLTTLLRSLHVQLPTLLTEPPDLTITTDEVQLRGLLRERLASGRRPIAAFFAAARRIYASLLAEGALEGKQSSSSGSSSGGGGSGEMGSSGPLEYRLVVLADGSVAVEWALESTLGPSWAAQAAAAGGVLGGSQRTMPPLRVGLPVRVRGEVRLKLDPQTAGVSELWVKSLSINERPVVPKLLESWVQRGASGPMVPGDVARDVRTVVSALLPWLDPNGNA